MRQSSDAISNEFLIEVLSLSKDATAVYDSEELHIRFVNDAMLTIWGKERNIVGETFEEAIPEIIGQPFVALLQQVWRTGETYTAKDTPANLVVNGKLQTFYFDFEYRAIQNESGKTLCLLHTATNVTERLAAWKLVQEKERKEQELIEQLGASNEELAATNEELTAANEEMAATNEELNSSVSMLDESQNRLRSIMERAPIGLCLLTGPDMVIELANDVILKTWGRIWIEVIGQPIQIVRPELKGQSVLSWLDEVYHTGITKTNNEFRVMLYHEGGLREAYVNSVYQALKNAKGEITGVLVVLEEITGSVRAKQEAQRMQDMFNFAVEAGELGTYYYDANTNQFSANALLKSWFGLQSGERMDLKKATEAITELDRERVTLAIQQALTYESGGNYDIEYTIIHPKTLIPRIVKAKGKTLFSKEHNAISLNGTLQDITERKQDEQRKSDFISMVSHELKTPLTSLSAYVQMLQREGQKNPNQFTDTVLTKASKQVRKMTSMINGFLNMSRLESGKIHIDKQSFDLAYLIKEVEEEATSIINSHQFVFAPVDMTIVEADMEKIGQVINNLISNAVKYSPVGSTIQVACINTNGLAQVSVKDEGIGVRQDDQEKLFERYYRVKGEQVGSIAGFGIGLYLCAEIIQRHQGNIWVESEEGKGSTFYFTLPVLAS